MTDGRRRLDWDEPAPADVIDAFMADNDAGDEGEPRGQSTTR